MALGVCCVEDERLPAVLHTLSAHATQRPSRSMGCRGGPLPSHYRTHTAQHVSTANTHTHTHGAAHDATTAQNHSAVCGAWIHSPVCADHHPRGRSVPVERGNARLRIQRDRLGVNLDRVLVRLRRR
jgi:hypothetical protein